MAISANIEYFFNDTKHDIQHFVETTDLENPPHETFSSNVEFYSRRFVDITYKISKKAVIHFPKTILIATLISTIISLIFFSISSLFAITLNIYFLSKFEKLLDRSIRIYNENNVSEWRSPVFVKRAAVLVIDPIEVARTQGQRFWNFIRWIFNS